MTITQTVLEFVGAPLAVAGVLALAVFGVSARRAPRYRPGRPFSFAPVWFLAAPTADSSATDRTEPTAGSRRPAIGAARAETAEIRPATRKGGARGTW